MASFVYVHTFVYAVLLTVTTALRFVASEDWSLEHPVIVRTYGQLIHLAEVYFYRTFSNTKPLSRTPTPSRHHPRDNHVPALRRKWAYHTPKSAYQPHHRVVGSYPELPGSWRNSIPGKKCCSTSSLREACSSPADTSRSCGC